MIFNFEVSSECHDDNVDGRDANVLVVDVCIVHRDTCAQDTRDFDAPDLQTDTGDFRE